MSASELRGPLQMATLVPRFPEAQAEHSKTKNKPNNIILAVILAI